MFRIFAGLEDKSLAYLDDIVVFNKDSPSHLASMRKVLLQFNIKARRASHGRRRRSHEAWPGTLRMQFPSSTSRALNTRLGRNRTISESAVIHGKHAATTPLVFEQELSISGKQLPSQEVPQAKDETVKPTLIVNETSLADLTDELKSVRVSKSSGAATD
ncbi:unnamed protein product [Cylicocyclus nassatus]|uniref:Reverse transcriptase domain-containing protein n=2 Tax=Cylicocyclus nassatus TaxID=53992 RepID=A0AA36ME21_CYLNA|nr:unnamed protein product [Cylicocyclus nassatus]